MGLSHNPVLLNSVIEGLNIIPNGTYIDCTFGRGGHSKNILEKIGNEGKLIAIDKDGEAESYAISNFTNDKRFYFERNNFSNIKHIIEKYNNSQKVYESIDAGDNWTNVSGSNLPALPVNCIVYQGGANDDLYIGTDVGVYHTDNTISDWEPYMVGLPNVIVKELEIHYDAGTISAATFGRGVWQSPLKTTSSTNTSEFSSIDFNLYPNPTKNQVIIQGISGVELGIIIYSLDGKKVLTTNKKIINTTGLKSGYYILEVKSESFISRKKLIIK
mgnify:CR=1 FL=1